KRSLSALIMSELAAIDESPQSFSLEKTSGARYVGLVMLFSCISISGFEYLGSPERLVSLLAVLAELGVLAGGSSSFQYSPLVPLLQITWWAGAGVVILVLVPGLLAKVFMDH